MPALGVVTLPAREVGDGNGIITPVERGTVMEGDPTPVPSGTVGLTIGVTPVEIGTVKVGSCLPPGVVLLGNKTVGWRVAVEIGTGGPVPVKAGEVATVPTPVDRGSVGTPVDKSKVGVVIAGVLSGGGTTVVFGNATDVSTGGKLMGPVGTTPVVSGGRAGRVGTPVPIGIVGVKTGEVRVKDGLVVGCPGPRIPAKMLAI
jgi:hypothetical protein